MKKKHLFKILIPLIAIVLWSCSTKLAFNSSSVVPAASGEVELKELNEDLYSVNVDLQFITEVDNLKGRSKYYVVWATSRRDTQNLGVLNVNDKLDGSFAGTATIEPEQIVISAERRDLVDEINGKIVLRSEQM